MTKKDRLMEMVIALITVLLFALLFCEDSTPIGNTSGSEEELRQEQIKFLQMEGQVAY